MTKPKPKTRYRPRANYAEWSRNCYSVQWPQLSRATKEATGGKCCLCRCAAKTTHHAWYTQGGLGDKPGCNLFPLCARHHRAAHQLRQTNKRTGKVSGNWIHASDDAVTGRYTTPEFLAQLRQGWKNSLVSVRDRKLPATKSRRTRKTKTARTRTKPRPVGCLGAIAGTILTLLAAL